MKPETYYPGHPFIESIIQDALNYDHIVVDGFAGFGGVTEGFLRTGKYKVIACINHWKKAIDTHAANHPGCLHIEEDFRTAELKLLDYMIRKIRRLKPSIQVHGWFSLECTNFSNAKGGMPRDADSRTLADHLHRWMQLEFDIVWIENVKEFLLWGPMIPKVVDNYCPLVFNKKTKTFGPWLIPDPVRKGEDFSRWKIEIESFGYSSERRLLNAADYGVPQHRIRLFMQFVRKGMPVFWPQPTHNKKGLNGLPKWVAIRTCLDLEDEGTDLLSFKKGKPRIKSPKTIQRLMTGCIKHVLNGKEFFITKYMGNNEKTGINQGKSIDEPSVTVPTSNRQAIVKAKLIDYYFGNGYTIPDSSPAGVSGTKDGASAHTISFITDYNHSSQSSSIDKASNTILAADKFAISSATIIDQTYGKSNPASVDAPAASIPGNTKLNPTRVQHIMQNYSGDAAAKNFSKENPSRAITGTGGNENLVTSLFIDQRYSSGQQNKSVDDSAGALTNVPKQVVTHVEHFVMDTQFDNIPHSTEDAAHTVTANRKHYYIINLQWGDGTVKHIEDPSATVIARMDKCPPYLVVTESGELALEVYPHDPPHYRAMKRFMAANGIISIKMRMLKETELLKIQTLPAAYKLTSSSTDNKKMIGNAVPSDLVAALAMAHYHGWKDYNEMEEAA